MRREIVENVAYDAEGEGEGEEDEEEKRFNRTGCGSTMYHWLCDKNRNEMARQMQKMHIELELYIPEPKQTRVPVSPRPQRKINLACIKINSDCLRTFAQAGIRHGNALRSHSRFSDRAPHNRNSVWLTETEINANANEHQDFVSISVFIPLSQHTQIANKFLFPLKT